MSVATDRVREVLAGAELSGCELRLTGQLDRPTYAAVDKVLKAAGGKWDRRAGAHVFPGSAADALGDYLAGGAAPKPARTTEGYVATPDHIADMVVREHTEIADMVATAFVLEPSAGDGAFVRAIQRANPLPNITAVEPNVARARPLLDGITELVADTFERYAEVAPRGFDAVVMNPPFAVPGQPTVWIDHVRLAYDLVRPGGRVTAIVPAGFISRQDKRHEAMRHLVADVGGWDQLPPDAFKASGTAVSTVVIWLDKPEPSDHCEDICMEQCQGPCGVLPLGGPA